MQTEFAARAAAEGRTAEEIGEALDKVEGWSAVGLDIGEVQFTNEKNETFVLTISKVAGF